MFFKCFRIDFLILNIDLGCMKDNISKYMIIYSFLYKIQMKFKNNSGNQFVFIKILAIFPLHFQLMPIN